MKTAGLLDERRPAPRSDWVAAEDPAAGHVMDRSGVLGDSTWRLGPLLVRSSLILAHIPQSDPAENGPTWHVSVSRQPMIYGVRVPGRATDQDLRRVRRDFDMRKAEEDNHHPGNARHLFLVVDPARRVACECKTGEVVVREPDGYTWSNDPTACRGCEIAALTQRSCPVHTPAGGPR